MIYMNNPFSSKTQLKFTGKWNSDSRVSDQLKDAYMIAKQNVGVQNII